MNKEILYRTEILPKNLKSMFNLLATFYNRVVKSRVVKSHKGKIRMSITQDSKGIDIRFRIPTTDFSNNFKVILGVLLTSVIISK